MLRGRALPVVLCLAMAGCGTSLSDAAPAGGAAGGTAGAGDRLQVAAAFYPLEFLARRLGGDGVAVDSLTAPGAEPHDLELTAKQVARLGKADLVVYLAGFQPAVDEAVEQQAAGAALDVSTVAPLQRGHVPIEDGVAEPDEEGDDPHVWLDPRRYAGLADAVAARLGELAPDQADAVAARAQTLRRELEQLDAEFRTGLADCRRDQIVTSHNAFGYLASAYGLEQVSITGLTPDEDAKAGRLAEVARYARARGVTTIFFEELVSPRVARSLADEVGARAVALDPLESPPDGGDYFTAMRADLAALQEALGCPAP